MPAYPERKSGVFFDTCVWLCLLKLGDQSPKNIERGDQIRSLLPQFESDRLGILMSPCIHADLPSNVRPPDFRRLFAPLEASGHVVVLDRSVDWEEIARLRERMREDIENDANHFQSFASNPRFSLGDVAVILSALRSDCREVWTYDPTMRAFSQRSSVRNIKICEPRPILDQPPLSMPGI